MNSELENLKQQANELLARITALESVEKEADWPKVGDEFWFVTTEGKKASCPWEGCSFNKGCMALGNLFRTKEEAEKELEARKVIAELRRCKGARKFVVEQRNYSVFVYFVGGVVCVDCWSHVAGGFSQAYFSTVAQAQAAIDKVGEDRIVAAAKWLAMGE